MKLDEFFIKYIVKEYQEQKNPSQIQIFQEAICEFVEEWTKITYHCSTDIARDFLVYILEFSEQIMLSYPKDLRVLFKTWFIAVLTNKFADFSKTTAIFSPYAVIDFDFFEETLIDVEYSQSLYYEQLMGLMDKLSSYEQSIVFFLYMPRDINEKHFYHLSKFFQKPVHIIMKVYHNILKVQEISLKNQETIQLERDKINQKIIRLEHMYKKTQNLSKKDSLVNKISYFKNRQYKLSLQIKTKKKILLKHFEELVGDYQSTYSLIRKIETKIRVLLSELIGDQ
ncbi:MAG: hypothetical protein ACRCTJ_02075 [Brevinema sp.]